MADAQKPHATYVAKDEHGRVITVHGSNWRDMLAEWKRLAAIPPEPEPRSNEENAR